MRGLAITTAALIVFTALLAVAPAAEAKQACSSINDRDCDEVVCVYNRVEAKWTCAGGDWYPPPCWHYCW